MYGIMHTFCTQKINKYLPHSAIHSFVSASMLHESEVNKSVIGKQIRDPDKKSLKERGGERERLDKSSRLNN